MNYTIPPATLIDGRVVPGNSEEWRMECLCRHLCSLPKDQRQAHYASVLKRSGPAAMAQLRDAVKAYYQAAQAKRKAA